VTDIRDDLPSLSVIIPTYNAAGFLAATLESIRRQDVQRIEVILADGGSSDATVEIAKQFDALDIKILSEPDKGQLDALQKGIRMATSDVLVWINGDDIVMPNAFRTALAALQEDGSIDFVYADNAAFSEEKRELYYGATIRGLNDWDHLLFYRQLYSECVYWRKHITKFLPDDSFDLRVYTDYAFFLNLRWGRKGRWIPKRLGAFRIRDGQASATFSQRKLIEYHRVKREHIARLGLSPGLLRAARIPYWPYFTLRQRAWPAVDRGLRKLRRLITRDRDRIRESSVFFLEWLKASEN